MKPSQSNTTQDLRVNAIRVLAADAVEQAQSGHPGMPMGMALAGDVLWQKHLKHNPLNPQWLNRDRFILSNGHGSMLLYALLHLTGYPLTIQDIQQFRQYGSHTPGHPEYDPERGVETTTGPLGQGFATACGMAIAEKRLAATYNQNEHHIIDHHTYVFAGDGCMMEGISHEAASLAGTLKLGKLILVWDDNGISIDGKTEPWFSEDVNARFRAYGWHVIESVNGNDANAIDQAFNTAKANTTQPTLIDLKTTIGLGSPTHQGTAKCHGAPLGPQAIAEMREILNWPHKPFDIPEAILKDACCKKAGQAHEDAWNKQFNSWQTKHPKQAQQLKAQYSRTPPESWQKAKASYLQEACDLASPEATRQSSGQTLNQIAQHCPHLFGGSADLTGSNNTRWDNAPTFDAHNPQGAYLHYGVREFGMLAILNGITLHQGFIPYGGTFLTFADYGKNAIRLAALMNIPTAFIFTHDSIGLGEDGPTHQPIEHLAMLRAIPNLNVWRPADRFETLVAWDHMLAESKTPNCLILSRQKCTQQKHKPNDCHQAAQGGYILHHHKSTADHPDIILVATGSEVSLAMEALPSLAAQGLDAAVVSMPCLDRFSEQSQAYQDSVLPPNIPRLFVEAGHPMSWYAYARPQDHILGIEHFGASAPAHVLFKTYGFTTEAIYQQAKRLLTQATQGA